jgi:2-oxoglutarate ferredoxin oxidoreductase subunit gamma
LRPFCAGVRSPDVDSTSEVAVEVELVLLGIGGQGIQLVGSILALAAINDGRHAQMYGEYGGEMRGGKSFVNIVIGAERLRALPLVSAATHVIALHQKFWEEMVPRLGKDAIVVADRAILDHISTHGRRVEAVPGIELALQAGNSMAAGLVVMGAFAAMTGIVQVDSLISAMKEVIPSYRRQHIATNEKAIHLGANAVKPLSMPIQFSVAA